MNRPHWGSHVSVVSSTNHHSIADFCHPFKGHETNLLRIQPKNPEEALEPVSVEYDSAPKLTPPGLMVSEEVDMFTFLVVEA